MDVLLNKIEIIKSSGTYLDIDFDIDEINVINSLDELRTLKILKQFPKDLSVNTKEVQCVTKWYNTVNKSLDGSAESIYSALIFFAVCNPILKKNVSQVFAKNGIIF